MCLINDVIYIVTLVIVTCYSLPPPSLPSLAPLITGHEDI